MTTQVSGDQSNAKPTVPVISADVVVMQDHEGRWTQFFVGQSVNWPVRKGAIDANRVENAMVEFVGFDGTYPFINLRSIGNGQTAKMVSTPCGVLITYGKLPVAKKIEDSDGNIIGEEYPLPEGCIRRGSEIIHKSLA